MTTAAPPEKMTNAELAERVKLAAGLLDAAGMAGRIAELAGELREAARRLSAPATHPNSAVVRFADEGTEHPWLRLRDVAYTREQATTLYNRARDGEPLTKDELYVAAAHAVHPLNGPLSLTPFTVGCLLQAYALKASAPAEAAPRVGDDAKHETWCASLATTRLTKQPYECNCRPAGYRKLAPAQSVGQSAAQRVGELVNAVESHWKRRLETEAYTRDELRGVDLVLGTIRRLSALPKGQDDE